MYDYVCSQARGGSRVHEQAASWHIGTTEHRTSSPTDRTTKIGWLDSESAARHYLGDHHVCSGPVIPFIFAMRQPWTEVLAACPLAHILNWSRNIPEVENADSVVSLHGHLDEQSTTPQVTSHHLTKPDSGMSPYHDPVLGSD